MSATSGATGGVTPPFLYGTAWKEERTAGLVRMALEAGFRGIDTANQRRHYHEAAVGEALSRAFSEGLVTRDELFIQTKFTHLPGQDQRLPYDPKAVIAIQVEQSFRSSLEHLGVEHVDSFVLHGPMQPHGWDPADREAWEAMEAIHDAGGAKALGVSNVTAAQVEELLAFARVPPKYVQNRCFAQLGWDARVRAVCRQHRLVHQPFSLLTANPEALAHPKVRDIAARHECTVPQVVFAFAHQLGMLPLTGTSTPEHARQDLAALSLELSLAEVATIERIAG